MTGTPGTAPTRSGSGVILMAAKLAGGADIAELLSPATDNGQRTHLRPVLLLDLGPCRVVELVVHRLHLLVPLERPDRPARLVVHLVGVLAGVAHVLQPGLHAGELADRRQVPEV